MFYLNGTLKRLSKISLLCYIPLQKFIYDGKIGDQVVSMQVRKQFTEINRQNIKCLEFQGKVDAYNSVILDAKLFDQYLHDEESQFYSNKQWQDNNVKAIWLTLNKDQLKLATTIQDCGFEMHHCQKDYILFCKWLIKDEKSRLPHYTTHFVGAGGLILNDKDEFLVVQEKNGIRAGNWGIPGGQVDDGELIHEAAIREVKEETGLDTEAYDLLIFREVLGYKFNKADIYFVVLLKLKNQFQEIKLCDKELFQYKWVKLDQMEQFFQENKSGPTQQELIKIIRDLTLKNLSLKQGFFQVISGEKTFYGSKKRFSIYKPNL